MKTNLQEEKEHEARFRKWVMNASFLQHWSNICLAKAHCGSVVKVNKLGDELIVSRVAENNIEIQRIDHEKEVETLKEGIKRLKEERVSLQRKIEEGDQVNADLQEQVIQLTKHVKIIPELRKDLNNLQNQRNNMDRKMKEQSEQARGTYFYLYVIIHK